MRSTFLLQTLFFASSLINPAVSTPFLYPGESWFYPTLPLPVEVIHQFPVGTWLGDFAFRHEGQILTTALSSPEIFQVDVKRTEPMRLLHKFANATSCTGITRMGRRDMFYVIVGSYSVSTSYAVPGSWSVYKVDAQHRPFTSRTRPPKVSLVAKFPDSVMLNEIVVLSKHKKWLLVSDSGTGIVYRLEAKTGNVVKVLEDPLMKPNSSTVGMGINGMKIRHHKLYFTNTVRNLLARMPIEDDGTSKTPAEEILYIDGPDGFTFSENSDVIVTRNRANTLGRQINNKTVPLAGGILHAAESELYGPTAVLFSHVSWLKVAFRNERRKAYISTNGGTAQYLAGNVTRGGTISMVDVRSYASSLRA